ncbi:MAG: hypothetical protein RIT40_1791, partial [Planctomycetota bacterium]
MHALPEELTLLRDLARGFANDVVRPLAPQIEREHRVPRELLAQMAEAGLTAVAVPTEYGGAGLGETGLCVVMEELTQACFATAVTFGAHASIGTMSVLVGGSPEQKQHWLPKMANGEVLGCYALSEANAGSDPAAMTTKAVRVDGGWRIDGEKVWITSGDMADLVTVFALTDPSAGARGVTAFLVPKGTPGLSVGKREEK